MFTFAGKCDIINVTMDFNKVYNKIYYTASIEWSADYEKILYF